MVVDVVVIKVRSSSVAPSHGIADIQPAWHILRVKEMKLALSMAITVLIVWLVLDLK